MKYRHALRALSLCLSLAACGSPAASDDDGGTEPDARAPSDASTMGDASTSDASTLIDAGMLGDAAGADAGRPASCGDDRCGPNDSCTTCPEDCGSCATTPPLTTRGIEIVLSAEEIVWRAPDEQCASLDLPDTNAHAMRIDGRIVMMSGNAPVTFIMEGADFDSLERRCTPALTSGDTVTAETYDHQEWIAATYYDGTTVHALVHDEYHDPSALNCRPGDTSPRNPCWWNSITYAGSADGARTFRQPTAPTHAIAPPPMRWDPTPPDGTRGAPPPHGYLEPSNIVLAPDGQYYSLFRSMPSRTDQTISGTCAMRTSDLGDPSAWRFWTGTAWDGVFIDPYTRPVGETVPTCAFVSNDRIRSMHGSLTYNTFLNAWLLVGGEVFAASGSLVCGVYASTSTDFIEWSEPVLLRTSVAPWLAECRSPGVNIEAYPSLIDHEDDSANFERTGESPYLYFMRWHSSGSEDRDLVRQRITFVRREP